MRTMLWLRRLHRWIGLAAVLPMIVLGITGVILALEPVWPASDDVPVVAGAVAKPDGEILAAAQALAPKGARPVRYMPAGAPGQAASVAFGGRGAATIRIDPVTLAQVGGAGGPQRGGFMGSVHALHENFLIQEFGGRSIVGWCGVALVLLTVIGIPIWWPVLNPEGRNWRAAFTFSLAAKGVRFHRRLHGAVGIWIAIVLFVNAFTGMMLGFPQTLRGWMGMPAGGPPRAAPARPDGPPPQYDLTAAMALARTALPGAVPRFVFLPANAGDPFRVFLGRPGGGAAQSGTAVIDAAGQRVLSLQDPGAYGFGEKVFRWSRDLHAGVGLGPVWLALTVVAGLSLPLFSITGFAMWWLRRRNRKRVRAAALAAAD